MQIGSWRALAAGVAVTATLLGAPGTAHAATPPAAQWPALSGAFSHIYQLEVAHNADGRLEVFLNGTLPGQARNALYHRWQLRGGGWSGWSQLTAGGGRFALANEADGRIRVFEAGSGTVRSAVQVAPDGGWGLSLGIDVPSGPGELVVAGRDTAGRIHVFATSDRGVIHQLDESKPDCGCWSSSQAGTFANGVTDLKLGYNADGRPEIFATDRSTDEVWHRWQWGNGAWAQWVPLGTPGFHSELTLLSDADGRLSVVTVTNEVQNARIVAVSQTGPNGGWQAVWRTLTTSRPDHDGWWTGVTAARNADGTPELYPRSEEDPFGAHLPSPNLYQLRLAPFIGSWSVLTSLDTALPPTIDADAFASGLDTTGRLSIFSARRTASGQLEVIFQQQPSPGAW